MTRPDLESQQSRASPAPWRSDTVRRLAELAGRSGLDRHEREIRCEVGLLAPPAGEHESVVRRSDLGRRGSMFEVVRSVWPLPSKQAHRGRCPNPIRPRVVSATT